MGGGGGNPVSNAISDAQKNPIKTFTSMGTQNSAVLGANPFKSITSPIGSLYHNSILDPVTGLGKSGDKADLEDVGPRPDIAGRNSLYNNGQLNANVTMNPNLIDRGQFQGNTGAINALNQRATEQGPSPWLKLQLQNQALQQHNQMGSAAQQANAGNANARAQLAMKGGLSGGAAERLARSGQQGLNQQRQQIANQGQQAQMGLGAQDEATKMGLLGTATNANLAQNQQQINMEQANAATKNAAQQFNIQNTFAENNRGNDYNMQKYQEQMKGYGAGKTANAIANSGKK